MYNTSTPTGVGTDGFRMKFDGNFFGTNFDALVFEKTDNGQSPPDSGASGFAFVNRGNNNVVDTALVIKSSGNIGIGTPNPSEQLEVIGNAKATKFIGDGSMLINLPSTSLWTENGGDIYRSSGKVGIGVIPTNNLSVRMNTEVLDVAQNDGTSSFLGTDLEWQSFTANRSGPLLGVILSFRASSTGISRVLTIYEGEGTGGTLLFTSDPISNTTNTTVNISGVNLTQGNKYTIAISNYRGWLFGSDTYAGGISSIGSIRDFRFQTYVYAQGAGFNVSDDAVGIGLPNPEEKLHIAGGIKIPDTVGTILYNTSTPTGVGTDGFRMRFDGNFFGTNFDALVFEKTDNGQSPPDSGASGFAFVSRGNNNIVDTALVIKSSGNIGIGTPNPGAKLQIIGGANANSTTGGYLINGDITTFNLALDDNEIAARNNGDPSNLFLQSRGGNTLMNANGGDVGIGTTSPTQKLDVNGQARIRNLPSGSGSTVVADVN
ncbi:MAG: hypothetical protein AAF599_13500, partial [Bacteroidota bacterium]